VLYIGHLRPGDKSKVAAPLRRLEVERAVPGALLRRHAGHDPNPTFRVSQIDSAKKCPGTATRRMG